MARIIDAILAINPSAKVVTRGSDIDTIEIDWVDTAEISKADIQTKLTELNNNEAVENAEESNQAVKPYIAQRKAAYPPIGDQLDHLWHSIDKNPDLKTQYFDFYEAIKAVKVKYGKDD